METSLAGIRTMLNTLGEIFAMDQIGFPILTLIIFLPAATALLIAFLKDETEIRVFAASATLISFLLSVLLSIFFVRDTDKMQFVEHLNWIPSIGASYHLGVDGISLLLFILTAFLSVLVVLFSWTGIAHSLKQYLICLLTLETTMLGVFASINLLLFFLFWEIMLLPMYFLVKIWGGERRDYASLKFVLYTLLGSVLMLIGFVILFLNYNEFAQSQGIEKQLSFDLLDLLKAPISEGKQIGVFVLLFFGFAFKVPMFPFHTWLPDAHVEAPTAGSVLLAGVLLKMGTYGFVRFSLPLLPFASQTLAPFMLLLAVIGIVYGALLALAQSDMKKLIAYSSISHLGFVVLGIFTLNRIGISGGVVQMINHGISTSGLFFVVGFLYNRRHTKEISQFGGLSAQVPILAGFYLLIALSSLAFPGTNGFVGELLILFGAAKNTHLFYLIPAIFGVLLGAAYTFWLYQRVMLGEIVHEENRTLPELNRREIGICTALAMMILWVGIYPMPFVKISEGSIGYVLSRLSATPLEETNKLLVLDRTPLPLLKKGGE
ncbi:MAG: NADH-quinone oxidoreductase subunit M [Nitrospirae bacterium]|nr:NADH-quinone oxidoreductase subunit M [Candidatus Troglogloeales bacterium]